MAICATRLGSSKQRPRENNSKVNPTKSACSSHAAIRRHGTWWQHCSGTRCDQRDLQVILELELRLWLKDQSQRTVQQANVNLLSNAELQKAQNVMKVIFLKRQSRPRSEQSRTPEQTSFGKTYKQEASLHCPCKWQKDLEKFQVEKSWCTSNDAFRRFRI